MPRSVKGLTRATGERFGSSTGNCSRIVIHVPVALSRTVAMHHLKAAGALSSKALHLAVAEVCTALRTDLAATIGWLATRYVNA